MRWPGAYRLLALAVVVLVPPAAARTGQDTFTATATVKKGTANASAPLTVVVARYATESETARVRKAASDGGSAMLGKALSGLEDAGYIQLGDRRTPIKFAASRSTGAGRLVTVLTAEPLLFLGAGLPESKPMTGFDIAIAMLILEPSGGTGELAPAAKVGIDNEGAIVIQDYGATVVWLTDVAAAK